MGPQHPEQYFTENPTGSLGKKSLASGARGSRSQVRTTAFADSRASSSDTWGFPAQSLSLRDFLWASLEIPRFPLKSFFKGDIGPCKGLVELYYIGSILGCGISYGPLVCALTFFSGI